MRINLLYIFVKHGMGTGGTPFQWTSVFFVENVNITGSGELANVVYFLVN